MSFYESKEPEKKKKTARSRFRKKTDYQKNSKNLQGDQDNLLELFFENLRSHTTLHEGQEEIIKAFFTDNFKYLFLRKGRKGAKTTTMIIIAWGFSLMEPNRMSYITLPTIALAEEIYWEGKRLQWCDIGKTDMADLFVKSLDNNKFVLTFINGSKIKLRGTWSEARGRGLEPNLLLVDEVKDCSADYLDGMEPNLAAKDDARCIMAGTPPKKRNHYHEWEDRIINNRQGFNVHYSSYINTALPHLKEWLDNKKVELIKAGKEDVWLREYMAEDCFSSDERILPDITVQDYDQMVGMLRSTDATVFDPIVAITVTPHKICASYVLSLRSRYTGMQMWVLKVQTFGKLWDISYEEIYKKIEIEMEEISSTFPRKWKKIVYDETECFSDVIHHITEARKDLKWKTRGIPLLKELILSDKIKFSTESGDFAIESQNLLKEDDIRDYPTVCTLAMLANEYYQASSLSKNEQVVWDRFAPLREAGIVCYPPEKKGKLWLSHNWS